MARLNDLMPIDHVVRITEFGTVEDAPHDIYAPEVYVECADDDAGSVLADAEAAMIKSVEDQGWELMTGYTGQWHYYGPIMHVSEYIGGQLEADIRSTPGLYVAVEVGGLYSTESQEQEQSDEPIGWVVARKTDAAYRRAIRRATKS